LRQVPTNGRLSRQIGQYDAPHGEQTRAASPRHFLAAALRGVPAHLDRKPVVQPPHGGKIGNKPTTLAVTYVVEKGKPLASPA
jgi:hypothetical protein